MAATLSPHQMARLLVQKGITPTALASKAGVDISVVRKLVNGSGRVQWAKAIRVAHTLTALPDVVKADPENALEVKSA